jgi:hypothetical protein
VAGDGVPFGSMRKWPAAADSHGCGLLRIFSFILILSFKSVVQSTAAYNDHLAFLTYSCSSFTRVIVKS